jgi:dienelactone hydrolase
MPRLQRHVPDLVTNWMRRISFGIISLALLGCAQLDHHCCEGPLSPGPPGDNTAGCPKPDQVLNAQSNTHQVRWSREVWVYRPSGNTRRLAGAGILLLHEINGASPACLHLARQFADQVGCPVYVPILFGQPGQDDSSTGFAIGFTDDDWSGVVFTEHHTPPVIGKLRDLKADLARRDGIKRWAVVGMCFTGSFPLAFLNEGDVKAAVVAQPATPLIHLTEEGSRSLGLSPEDLAAAAKSSAPVYGIRFEGDCISPEARLAHIASLVGKDRFKDGTIHQNEFGCYVKMGAHNTLTYTRDLHDPANPVNQHVAQLIRDLRTWLKANTN